MSHTCVRGSRLFEEYLVCRQWSINDILQKINSLKGDFKIQLLLIKILKE